jgi:hypothetical protein
MSRDTTLILLVLAAGIWLGMQLKVLLWQMKRGGKSRRYDRYTKVVPFQPPREKKIDAADQLRTVMKADFKAQPLLNKSEARLFRLIDKIVLELRPNWQVMGQVSLGEILRCDDKEAYWCINAKRVDLLIVDAECRPIGAIEYQGGAHFKGAHATAARDAVKKEALRRAGIGYEEVKPGDTPADLQRMVERLVQKAN